MVYSIINIKHTHFIYMYFIHMHYMHIAQVHYT